MMRAMRLKEWLADHNIAQWEFARKVGLTQSRISQIAKYGTDELRTALAIQKATNNQVTLPELLREDTRSPQPPEAA